ncbi:MAG: ion channel DMI1 [Deltaproteobacteria bacterium]|nr:ion channel DMI1 [Deltaproteobacteria bacterium]
MDADERESGEDKHMRLANIFRFALERYLIRGAHYQLLAVAALIGLISVLGGVLVRWGAGGDGTTFDSVWWAFLRLTDPGYLGDDTGFYRRAVSTILTVLGYVLFMGSLVAILSQWLNSTMRRFEAGFTPVVRKNHILILGWTARAGTVIRDLFLSEERVRRFLQRRGARRLHIVLLAEEVGLHLMQEIRSRVGAAWNPRRITLRTGSALRGDHLKRVDFLHASAILLPAGEFSEAGPENADTHTIKTLLSLSNHPVVEDPGRLPLAVAEIFDARKEEITREAYKGPIEVLAGSAVIARLITQTVRHPGLSHVYSELLTHASGCELFVREAPEFAGASLERLSGHFPDAVLLGAVRSEEGTFRPHLDVSSGFVAEKGDRMVLMARSYEDTRPAAGVPASGGAQRGAPGVSIQRFAGTKRVLVMGWSHKVPRLIAEFASYPNERFAVDVASTVPSGVREAAVERYSESCTGLPVRQQEADYTVRRDLERLEPAAYDNIVMVGSDRLPSGEESDARTIVGYLHLQEILSKEANGTRLLVELMDPENVGLLGRNACEVLISPVILSHMLAQVALRRELACVFDELFTTTGAEIVFMPVSGGPWEGRTVSFSDIEEELRTRGCTALGVHRRGRGVDVGSFHLNPAKSEAFALKETDEIVLLTTYD